MIGPNDSRVWRVYTAEQAIDTGAKLNGIDDARHLVHRVRRSAWWRDHASALVSRASLAASVSPVEPCTARDIKVLEDAPTLPDSPRLRRIAMTAVAVLNVDPVWARTNLGLVRWDCGVDLEELRTVAEAWVQFVDHLNALAAELPPRGVVEGDR